MTAGFIIVFSHATDMLISYTDQPRTSCCMYFKACKLTYVYNNCRFDEAFILQFHVVHAEATPVVWLCTAYVCSVCIGLSNTQTLCISNIDPCQILYVYNTFK